MGSISLVCCWYSLCRQIRHLYTCLISHNIIFISFFLSWRLQQKHSWWLEWMDKSRCSGFVTWLRERVFVWSESEYNTIYCSFFGPPKLYLFAVLRLHGQDVLRVAQRLICNWEKVPFLVAQHAKYLIFCEYYLAIEYDNILNNFRTFSRNKILNSL